MPKTRFQEIAFTGLMVFCMVYTMTAYNLALENGVTYQTFADALRGMWAEAAVAFFAQRYVARPLAARMMAHMFADGQGGERLRMVAMAGCNVMLMAPMMTLFVSALHGGVNAEWPLRWLPKLLLNFPFALCVQIFYIGPLVRTLFRRLFRRGLARA